MTYDGNPHTATGTATGVNGESLSSLLDLSGTTHTSAGDYAADAWTFAGNGNYNAASGRADDLISRPSRRSMSRLLGHLRRCGTHGDGHGDGAGRVDLSSLLNLSGTTHTNAGTYNGDAWASPILPATTPQRAARLTISSPRPTRSSAVTPYSVTYDGTAHTATGTATGVESPTPVDLSSLLNLSGTTHTNAGDYATDAWTFAGNGNYNAQSGTTHDVISQGERDDRRDTVQRDVRRAAHTATGTATGVLGATGGSAAWLDLGGTTHTNAGTYNGDAWTFAVRRATTSKASGTVNDSHCQGERRRSASRLLGHLRRHALRRNSTSDGRWGRESQRLAWIWADTHTDAGS